MSPAAPAEERERIARRPARALLCKRFASVAALYSRDSRQARRWWHSRNHQLASLNTVNTHTHTRHSQSLPSSAKFYLQSSHSSSSGGGSGNDPKGGFSRKPIVGGRQAAREPAPKLNKDFSAPAAGELLLPSFFCRSRWSRSMRSHCEPRAGKTACRLINLSSRRYGLARSRRKQRRRRCDELACSGASASPFLRLFSLCLLTAGVEELNRSDDDASERAS